MRLFIVLILAIAVLPFSAFAQEDTKVEKIRDKVHLILSPKGGNIVASVGEDGVFLIDDQLKARDAIIKEVVSGFGRTLKFILNTHYHHDHTGGNELLGGEGAIIVAHESVRERLSRKEFITFFNKSMGPLAKQGLPVVSFSEDITFHFNGDDINMIHIPNAHTDGDSIAHFVNTNVIAAGDVIFNDAYPFYDVEHGGSIKGIISGLDAIIKLSNDQTVIVPGHGPNMTLMDLKAYRDMMATIAERVEAGIKAGKTQEQIVAEKPTQEFDSRMKKKRMTPEKFLSIVYTDLSR